MGWELLSGRGIMNAPRYFYHDQVSDRVLGPVSIAKLRWLNLVSVQGTLQVCREGTEVWMPANEAMKVYDDEIRDEAAGWVVAGGNSARHLGKICFGIAFAAMMIFLVVIVFGIVVQATQGLGR